MRRKLRRKLHAISPDGGLLCHHPVTKWRRTPVFSGVTCRTCLKIGLRCGIQTTLPL